MRVRPPAVAGSFYPADPAELRATVRALLAGAEPPRADEPAPKALVAPHAGYVYSGPVAATAFRRLVPLAGRVRRVVLLGPSHYVPLDGLAFSPAERFRTPAGEVAIDRTAFEAVADLPQVTLDATPHAREHSLEVELPFLAATLGDFVLAPFSCGEASAAEVAEVLGRLAADEATLVVVSTDLSHYLDDAAARRRDAATSAAIERLDDAAIGDRDACGRVPLRGLLAFARERGWSCRRLDLRNSADTAGPADQVVGYGAYAFA